MTYPAMREKSAEFLSDDDKIQSEFTYDVV